MKRKGRRGSAFDEIEEPPDIWQRLSRVLLVIVFLLAMAGIVSLFWPEVERQRSLDEEMRGLGLIRDAKQKQRDQLTARLEWMRTDPEYLETIARDRLDLYREGESIIRIEDGTERDRRTGGGKVAPILKPAPVVK